MATALDIRVFRERWNRVGRLQDWTDDEVACIVDIVDRMRGDRTFEELCVFEGGIIETFRVAKAAGYVVIKPYVRLSGQASAEFARQVVRDLVRRFPGRVAEELYPQARQLAMLTNDQIYHGIWGCIGAGEIVLSQERTLMPAMESAIEES